MANPVYIDFIVRGIPNALQALKTVQDAAGAAERANTQRTRSESKTRSKLRDDEAKYMQRVRDRSAQMAGRFAAQQAAKEIRERDKTAREAKRIAERAARDEERAVERSQQNMARIRQRSAEMAGRYYAQLARQEQRANFVRERDEMRNRRRFANHVGGAAVGGLVSGANRVARLAMGAAGMIGQLGSGFSLADSVERNAKNAGEVADLINSGINPLSQNRVNKTRRDRRDVEGALDVATTTYGLDRGSAIEGLRAFTGKTGDFDTALKLLPKLAELSRATGTSLDQMAGAAGQAGLAFDDIADGGKKAEKIMQVMRIVAGQGKAGTVEATDMVTQMGKLVATASKFDGDNVENLAKMGMIAQFAAGGGGAWNAASAATAVTNFGAVFGKGARLGTFESMGIKVFADKNQTILRPPEEIIADSIEKTDGGSQPKMAALYGSVMAKRAVDKFGGFYRNGYEANDGKKYIGREAVLHAAQDMTHAQMTKGEVREAAGFRMKETDAKMAQIREQFDKAVREKVIPTLLALVPQFEKFAQLLPDIVGRGLPAFMDLIKTVAEFVEKNRDYIQTFADHPIATIVGAELTKTLGPAVLGEAAKLAISKTFGDAGMGAAFQGLNGKLGQLAAAAGIAGAALLAIQVGKKAIDDEYSTEDALRNRSNSDQASAASLTARLRNGTATAKERQEAAQMVGKLQGDRDALQTVQDNPGFFKKAGGALAGLTDEGKQAQADEAANNQKSLADLDKTMRELMTAMRDNTNATKGNTSGTSGGPNGAARSQSTIQRNGIK